MEGDGESLGILKGISPGSGSRQQPSWMAGTSILGPTPPPGTPDPLEQVASVYPWSPTIKHRHFRKLAPPPPHVHPRRPPGMLPWKSHPPLFFSPVRS